MFWGLRLEPGKRYSTTVGKSFHVSMAALDCSSVKNELEVNSVMLEETELNVPFILCNLQKQKNLQCPLDLNFMTGDRITFFCKGNGTIHLTGYVHDERDFDTESLLGEEEEDEEAEDEEEDEEEDGDTLSPGKKQLKANGLTEKRRREDQMQAKKKAKLDASADDSDGMEDMGDLELGDSDGMEDMDDLELGGDSDDDEEDDEDEDESENDEEDSSAAPKQQKNKNAQSNKSKQQPQNGVQLSKKEKKEAAKQKNEGAQKQQKDKPEGAQMKTIQGGVQIKDIKVGSGNVCKPGQKASVYYVGRLKANGKVFDSAKKGSPFTFTVGKGEVIKAWDVGVSGMKVGGKRTIICPPNMAYGQRGSPPTIPKNSTLVFEVELKHVLEIPNSIGTT
ncbi:hypothetical protein GE061_014029 [Apolygus lucorum]|uniref:FK506-binding protein n=1 Tax=Apolygus lucorum TaxID=248454 RepID=A0A8S9XPQ4_APOLU|nr:hypothetical protein GE061_014029 [Apolygus lucorum]